MRCWCVEPKKVYPSTYFNMLIQGDILNNVHTSTKVVHTCKMTGCKYMYGTYCITIASIQKELGVIVCIIDNLKLWGII